MKTNEKTKPTTKLTKEQKDAIRKEKLAAKAAAKADAEFAGVEAILFEDNEHGIWDDFDTEY
jgi:hypothetical protein